MPNDETVQSNTTPTTTDVTSTSSSTVTGSSADGTLQQQQQDEDPVQQSKGVTEPGIVDDTTNDGDGVGQTSADTLEGHGAVESSVVDSSESVATNAQLDSAQHSGQSTRDVVGTDDVLDKSAGHSSANRELATSTQSQIAPSREQLDLQNSAIVTAPAEGSAVDHSTEDNVAGPAVHADEGAARLNGTTASKVAGGSTAAPSDTPSTVAATTESALESTAPAPATSAPLAPSATTTATSSVTSTLAPAAVPSPPTPSISPAPHKKFQSSLSVNKKFLEKATDKSKPEVKPATPRLATPPIPAPVSSVSHPRLLTGKISTASATATSGTTGPGGSASAAPAGWHKADAPSAAAAGSAGTGAGGLARPTPLHSDGSSGFDRGRLGMGQQSKLGSSGPVWGRTGGAGGQTGYHHVARDFPTAQEAAHAKNARAHALMEQMQARERAIQARAAAAAAANAHLLEGLDAFRGIHLDPNASHWDEDEDNDFLDDTIEFGDGTQYKIVEEVRAETPGGGKEDELHEPLPSDMARREAPLVPGEANAEPTSREERFKDDYDRSWSRRTDSGPAGAASSGGPSGHAAPADVGASRTLFNERLNKLEPYAGRPGSHRPGSDLPPHLDARAPPPHAVPSERPRRESLSSQRPARAPLPPQQSAWERGAPNFGGAAARRPSIEQQQLVGGARRPSVGAGAAGEGRQLPPHLAATAAPSSAPVRSVHPTLRTSMPVSASASVSAATPASAPAVEKEVAPSAAPAPAPAPEEDLEALHAREMHAAAERAKKRRQEEEQARLEQVERARKKALELEVKSKKAEEDKARAKSEAEAAAKIEKEKEKDQRARAQTQAKSGARPSPNEGIPSITSSSQPVAPQGESWRKPVSTTGPAASTGPRPSPLARAPATTLPPVQLAPASRPEPTKILTREQPLDREQPASSAPPSKAPGGPPISSSVAASTSTTVGQRAPLEPQDRAWRRADAAQSVNGSSAGQKPAPKTRQSPPHQAGESSQQPPPKSQPRRISQTENGKNAHGPRTSPEVVSTSAAGPVSQSSVVERPAKAGVQTVPEVPAVPTSPPTSSVRRASASGFKQPEVSQINDVMQRIKGVMTPSARDLPEAPEDSRTKSTESEVEPTVRLPRAPKSAPTVQPHQGATAVSANGSTRGRAEKKAVARGTKLAAVVPAFESREPLQYFGTTRFERASSPPPAWKRNAVQLAAHRVARTKTPAHRLKAFQSLHFPAKVDLLSWDPPIKYLNNRTLSRDETLHSKKYVKGTLQYHVTMPRTRIQRRKEIEWIQRQPEPQPPPDSPTIDEKPTPAVRLPMSKDKLSAPSSRPSTADTEGPKATSAQQVVATAIEVTTAPSAEALFDASPSRVLAAPQSGRAFYRAANGTNQLASATAAPAIDRSMMVTGELGGDIVQMGPRETLAAPGADMSVSSSNALSNASAFTATPASSTTWAQKGPFSLSVLDPTAPTLWSAPPKDTPVHSRSISLGGPVKQENSLHGIADDDFPGSIPSSLADLKAEDEPLVESAETKRAAAKDEARLRAAAPSFSASFRPESLTPEDATASRPHLGPRYPSYGRPEASNHLAYPSLTQPLPQSYSPQPTLAAAYSQVQPQTHHYVSYGVVPGMSYGSSVYQQPAHYATYATHHPSLGVGVGVGAPSSPYQTAYRSPQPAPSHHAITNPALLSSYSGGYGVVGSGAIPGRAVSHGHARPTSGNHGYAVSAYGGPSYGAGTRYGASYGPTASASQHEQHAGSGISAGYSSPSPVVMPRQRPPGPMSQFQAPYAALQQQQQQQQQQQIHSSHAQYQQRDRPPHPHSPAVAASSLNGYGSSAAGGYARW